MKVVGKCLGVACAAAMLLAVASVASAQLSDDDRKCSDKINNDARKVLAAETKGNRKECVKDQTGDQTACINADRAKSTEKCAKLTADHADKCATLPAFGVNASPAAICDATQEAADDIIRAIFGDPVDGLDGSGCDDKMAHRAGQMAVKEFKAFRKCAKDLAAINSIGDLEGCIFSGIGSVVSSYTKVFDAFNGDCGGAKPAGAGDGICGGEVGTNFVTCVMSHVSCNVCLAANETINGGADCSIYCNVGAPSHKCTFDGATDNSELEIILAGGTFQTLNISGAIDITCDPDSEDGMGIRFCQCNLQVFNPVNITGIGFVCVDPAGPCPLGAMDCDGGGTLGIDLRADHQAAGLCTSNADCASNCATHCAGLGKGVFLAACEGFCQGGAQADEPCNCDTQPAATCTTTTLDSDTCEDTVMGGTNAGSCEGKDDERGGGGQDLDCHCQCIDVAFAAHGASAAGDMGCFLGTAIRVETNLPCDNVGTIVRLPPLCGPFTTQRATARISNANEAAGTFVPPGGDSDQSGAEIACATFDTSTTAGMEIVGNLAFFDSTVGDLMSELRVDCQ